jgi:Domain of unknown function (DUF4189)
MGRQLPNTLAVLAFLGMLLSTVSAFAGFGAVAWDKETGKTGWIWNQPTAQKAAEKALSECGATGCRIVIKPTSDCAAVATTSDGRIIGAAARKTQDAARLKALTDCQKRKGGECVVRASDCNK